MTTTTVSPDVFAKEADRRLIDSFELRQILGLRTYSALMKRVEAGKLPKPIYKSGSITLWDRDAIPNEGG